MESIADFFRCRHFFFWAGTGFAFFFGVRGALITWVRIRAMKRQALDTDPWPLSERPWPERCLSLAEITFQFCFNAAGGLVGWIAAWFLWSTPLEVYGWKHLIVFVIAFVGVSGNLPHLSTGVRDALGAIGKRVGG
jgi:hypothetical protein